MQLSDYVIYSLGEYGIDTIFQLYGAASGPLVDSFTRTDKTKYVAVMNEQAAGFAAEIYVKVKGKPGVALATSGPGGQNLLTAIANCFYDSVHCIFLTGQIHSEFLRPDPTIRQVGFQECDIVAMASPVTKYSKIIVDPKSIRFEMEKALFICQHGRPGPILLDIPIDIQKIDINPEELLGFQSNAVLSNYDLDYIDKQIDRYIEDLYQAERPVFMIGGGIRIADAVDEYRELAKRLKMPSFPTWNATDIVTSDFEYYGGRIGTYGGAGRNLGIQNTDLLMAIGSRIPGRVTGGNVKSFARGAKKYVVDVDEALLQKHLQQLPFEETICCDAKIFIKRFLEKIDRLNKPLPDYSKWTDKVMEWKIKYDPVLPQYFEEQEYVHPYAFMRILSEKMDKNGIHVGDHGGTTVVKHHAFETKYGQLNLGSNGNAPMGFSFAAAMGAWFADSSRQLVCTIGDGGYNLNIQ